MNLFVTQQASLLLDEYFEVTGPRVFDKLYSVNIVLSDPASNAKFNISHKDGDKR